MVRLQFMLYVIWNVNFGIQAIMEVPGTSHSMYSIEPVLMNAMCKLEAIAEKQK